MQEQNIDALRLFELQRIRQAKGLLDGLVKTNDSLLKTGQQSQIQWS